MILRLLAEIALVLFITVFAVAAFLVNEGERREKGNGRSLRRWLGRNPSDDRWFADPYVIPDACAPMVPRRCLCENNSGDNADCPVHPSKAARP